MKPENIKYINDLKFLKNKNQVLEWGKKIHSAHRALITQLEKKSISYELEESGKYLRIFLAGKIHITRLIDYGINSASVDSIFEDKFGTNNFLRQFGLPAPAEISFSRNKDGSSTKSFSQIKDFCETVGYPLIMKPNNGQRGRGVHVIYDERVLKQHFENFLTGEYKKDFAILQKFVKGKEVRIIYLDGEILVVYQKQPLKIIGDGKKTISQLIKLKEDVTPQLFSQAQNALKDKKIDENSILGKDKTLQVFDFINPACEQDYEIDFTLEDTKFIQKIAQAFGSDYFGLDLITSGEIKDGIILEINPKPAIFRAAKISPSFKQKFWEKIADYIIKKYN